MKKVIIIGAGLAGSYAACLLQNDHDITVVTKGDRTDSNSMLAQGGIAASLDPGDSPAAHEQDTLTAGKEHNNRAAVEQLVTLGPQIVTELIRDGMPFDRTADGKLSFGLEGAHSFHRILHADGDQTGHAVTTFVQQHIRNVRWLERTTVLQLLVKNSTCYGVLARRANGRLVQLTADAVILASGGLGRLYPLTTNDETVTGDGYALADRAGAAFADMAFVQFHPTLLAIGDKCYGLITEAIRGAGAHLVDENNRRIMADIDGHDLAPRDVVTRQITACMAEGHKISLDISEISNFAERFPGVSANLHRHRVPFATTKRIPIRPGAHFMMGGVKAGLHGETSINRLWAIGEVACNGVHGANRLASNSLLDCLVGAHQAVAMIRRQQPLTQIPFAMPQPHDAPDPDLPAYDELTDRMWRSVGVMRTHRQMQQMLNWLGQYNYRALQPADLTAKQLCLANLCISAELVTRAALREPGSLGAHYLREEVRA